MSSRRIACSVAVLVFGVVGGSWYVVGAFPLMQAPGVVQSVPPPPAAGGPGPLERAAKAITPENPIPRRTYSVMPKDRVADKAGPVAVTLRVTINALGRVGEVRTVSSMGDVQGSAAVFVKASLDAVRQWVYEPPADAPISFAVTFLFAPASEARLVVYGGPVGDGGSPAGAAGAPSIAVDGAVRIVPPPPPPPPPWIREGYTNDVAPVRVGGNIRPPQKLKDVRPVFPQEARDAGVQGVVILEAVIGPDGRVDRIAVLRSIAQLDSAAIEAVKEWEFTPTLLNGAPIPVLMTVTVNFTLN